MPNDTGAVPKAHLEICGWGPYGYYGHIVYADETRSERTGFEQGMLPKLEQDRLANKITEQEASALVESVRFLCTLPRTIVATMMDAIAKGETVVSDEPMSLRDQYKASDTGIADVAGLGGDRVDPHPYYKEPCPACDVCGTETVRNGNCYKCYNCGSTLGCS